MTEGPDQEVRIGEAARILGISESAVRNLPPEVLRPSKRLPGRGDRYYLVSALREARKKMQTAWD